MSGKEQLERAKKRNRQRCIRLGDVTIVEEDPELRRLAMALLETVLKSRADSTTKKYLGAFQRWNFG